VAHVVVGLGNPGPEYRDTRHNVGQRVLDTLAGRFKKAFRKDGQLLVAHAVWRGEPLHLVKPLTFMNVSGPAVAAALRRLRAEAADLILVYDDIDLPLGVVRSRLRGSSGGHHGVESVINTLGTDQIRRVKIGIDRPEHKRHVPDHVLATFEPQEETAIAAAVDSAADRVLALVRAKPGIAD